MICTIASIGAITASMSIQTPLVNEYGEFMMIGSAIIFLYSTVLRARPMAIAYRIPLVMLEELQVML